MRNDLSYNLLLIYRSVRRSRAAVCANLSVQFLAGRTSLSYPAITSAGP